LQLIQPKKLKKKKAFTGDARVTDRAQCVQGIRTGVPEQGEPPSYHDMNNNVFG
jgi:hypothetical protein